MTASPSSPWEWGLIMWANPNDSKAGGDQSQGTKGEDSAV